MDKKWVLLDQTMDGAAAASDLPSGLFAAIATRLEDALADGSRETLLLMQEQLGTFLKVYLKRSDKSVVDAIRRTGDVDANAAAAYALGQISFAQLLAAQAGSKRADDQFENVINDNADIVRVLLEKDRTGLELAEATGLRPETISRKVKLLRENGVTDFYREGTSLMNFLTPAAKAVAIAIAEAPSTVSHGGSAVRRNINARRKALPDYMHHALTFAPANGNESAPVRIGCSL